MTDQEARQVAEELAQLMASPRDDWETAAFSTVRSVEVVKDAEKGSFVEIKYFQDQVLLGHRQGDLNGLGGQMRKVSPDDMARDIRDFVIVEPQGRSGAEDHLGRYWSGHV